MLNSFGMSVFIGSILGFLSGLGTGGGSLLILWLTLVVKMPQPEARILNLMFFIPAALISCIFRWKQGNLPLKKVFPGILSGCAAAFLCAWFTGGTTSPLLRKAFGVLLLITGVRELIYKEK